MAFHMLRLLRVPLFHLLRLLRCFCSTCCFLASFAFLLRQPLMVLFLLLLELLVVLFLLGVQLLLLLLVFLVQLGVSGVRSCGAWMRRQVLGVRALGGRGTLFAGRFCTFPDGFRHVRPRYTVLPLLSPARRRPPLNAPGRA